MRYNKHPLQHIPSRILTLRAGGFLTFGALEEGKESAPGQIPVRDLREMYRAHQIGPRTRVFGLVGDPVGHSLSPAIHNAAFQALGLDAVYVPFQIRRLGNLTADETGTVRHEFIDTQIAFAGPHSIIGRGVIVHAAEDDLVSQPTGAAGARVACGVVGIARQ